MIIETALVELAKAGGTELFLSSSESLLKKVKTAKDIKQLFINTGEIFVDYENDADQLFDDMANVLSKENMTKLANELKDEPGYKLKDIKLFDDIISYDEHILIPHPRAHERQFVMKPMCDINPYYVHPIYRKRVMDISSELGEL